MTQTSWNTRARRLWTAGLLAVLWAAAAVPLVVDATRVARTHTVTQRLGTPTDAVIVGLQEERRLSAGYLAGVVPQNALTTARAHTDEACQRLLKASTGWTLSLTTGSAASRTAQNLVRRLDQRLGLRTDVDNRAADEDRVITGYTDLITAAFAGAPWLWPDQSSASGSRLLDLARAGESLSEQEAWLSGTTGAARLAGPARVRLTGLIMNRRLLLAQAPRSLTQNPAAVTLQEKEDHWIGTTAGTQPLSTTAWLTALNGYRSDLRTLEVSAIRAAAQAAVPGAVATVAGAGLLAGVGLVVVLAVAGALWRNATGLAAPPEVPQVQATSLDAADRMLELITRINRGSQALLHRQLRLLDALQRRRAGDGETLGDLFLIDHLGSRLRRNIEKTVILTGGTPARRWQRPVPLADVVRAAAAEIADSERVATANVEPADLAGAAVTDVMHLLAELIENAVRYAPAEARVRVTGRRGPDQYIITVTDHGPGMSQEDLQSAAEVIRDPTPPATDAWWGFHTAGRLAQRCGISIRLRNGDDDGLVATVSVPATLITDSAGLTPEEALVRDIGTGVERPDLQLMHRIRDGLLAL